MSDIRDVPGSTGVAGGRSLIRRQRLRRQKTVEIVGLREMMKYMEKVGDRVMKSLGQKIVTASVIVQHEIIRSERRHFKQRTGRKRKSWQLQILARRAGGPSQLLGGNVTGIVGSRHPASRIHEYGGTIRPKKAGALTVPLTEEARKRPARDWGDELHIKRVDAVLRPGVQDALLVDQAGRAHFQLTNSVQIPAFGYLTDAVQRSTPRVLAQVGEGVSIGIK